MMKRTLILVLLLLVFSLWLTGCGGQLGETRAEIRRDHWRTLRTDYQEMLGDLDRGLLMVQPTKLTDKLVE